MDNMFAQHGESALKSYFDDNASISVLDDEQESGRTVMTADQYALEMQNMVANYQLKIEPVVIQVKGNASYQAFLLSTMSTLVDSESRDTLRTRDIRSIRMLRNESQGWRIHSMIIQSGFNPSLDSVYWPEKITSHIDLGISAHKTSGRNFLNVDEVDIAPSYPGGPAAWQTICSAYNVVDKPSDLHTPFTVFIEEDGMPTLGYVGDLSGEQIESATSFVKNMPAWYPAVKDNESTRCKLVMYIR